MELHRPGAAYRQWHTKKKSKASMEAKSEDTKAGHQSPVHPKALHEPDMSHIGVNVTHSRIQDRLEGLSPQPSAR